MAELTGHFKEKQASVPIDQALHIAPVIFVDGAHSFTTDGHICKFNFFADFLNSEPTKPDTRVVVARMVMSAATVRSLAGWLAGIVSEISRPEIIEALKKSESVAKD